MKKIVIFLLVFAFAILPSVTSANILIENVTILRDGEEVKRPIPMDEFFGFVMEKIEELEETLRLAGIEPINTVTVDRELKLGDSGAEVRDLQVLLNNHEATRLTTTGVGSLGQETIFFGSLTKSAVERFQLVHEIPVTGAVNRETMEAINSLYVR